MIYSPHKDLAFLQYCLSLLLKEYYTPNSHASGFIDGRSILYNVQFHTNKDIVYTIDLKDYFMSINDKRIIEVLMKKPYCFSYGVAKIIADLTTVPVFAETRVLPQGTPVSPLITNIVSDRLDLRLSKLSEKYNFGYSRYADDITFSLTYADLKRWNPHGFRKGLRQIIEDIIVDEGFVINSKKTRVSFHYQRQLVTGLVVNTKPNIQRKKIKRIRTILHNWEIDGYVIASHKFFKNREVSNELTKNLAYMENVVCGYLAFIEMVKGSNDPTLLKLKERYNALKIRDRLFILGNTYRISQNKKLPNLFIDKPLYVDDKNLENEDKWHVIESRPFNEVEMKMVDSLEVVPSQFGNSVMFSLTNGKIKHVPLSQNSIFGVGDSFDLSRVRILTLRKHGRRDIWRIE